ncbi:hypothetical protein [Haladaptatus sp. DYF46]|uniref:hypothetical protein n=1 Tax=Haladaptatus sp. DYF46 TaxID=2886041 RepID=UPI001E435698|nr:hypothetical protein [Haladaptatus sp. DYF46]
MDETKRRRLSLIWIGFSLAMVYYALADGFDGATGELLSLLVAVFGIGLAVLYYFNPRDVLSFG